ncbi:RDD family protein [Aggregicoccus sp. 17bor-14]|uniref:RDD family protein n=1 Tax=Myxococcaceae TaxID=31 RepID=UPI003519D7F4
MRTPPAAAPASALPLAGPLPAARAPASGLPLAAAPAMAAPPPAPVAPAPVVAAVSAPAPAPATGVEVHARPASLWRRLLSFTVDAAVILGLAALYLVAASAITGLQGPRAELGGLDGLVLRARAYESILLPGLVLTVLLALVYCAVAAFLWNGRTLGRRLLGLRLVDTHGLAPAPTRAVVRAVLAGVSFAIFLGGFWLALFDRRGQTLHDKLTSTFVVQPS